MDLDRRDLLRLGTAGAASLAAVSAAAAETLNVSVALGRPAGTLPHIWSECAGSDRAAITMRESWRRDLDRWIGETGLKRVRFHGIFNDELGVLAPSILNLGKIGAPNFQNVDQVYDGLVARGIAPLVELSFMPAALASGQATFGFYKGNITPPKSMDDWATFIRQFTGHLVDRYGRQTVATWAMEVWNEANLPFFWTSDQQTYFDLYKATAMAIKSVEPRIKVGGPATAQGAWIADFAAYCAAHKAPVDFFSTHSYAGDNQAKVFGSDLHLPQSQVIPEVVRRCRQQIEASRFAGTPLWITEWSADSPALIAHVIADCLPHCQMMSQWTMSSTYEELGVSDFVLKEGDMGYGTMVDQIAKTPFNTYKLMHRLGTARLAADGPVLATRRADGQVAALVWNLAEVKQASGIPGQARTRSVVGSDKALAIRFDGARAGQAVRVSYVDQERGSPLPTWRKMGSPQYPRPDQLAALRKAADIAPATAMRLGAGGTLTLQLPAEGVALVEFV